MYREITKVHLKPTKPNGEVREGLRLLKEHEKLKQLRLAELRKEIAVGIEQADQGEFVDGPEALVEDTATGRPAETTQRMKPFIETAERGGLEKPLTSWLRTPASAIFAKNWADRRHRFFLVYSYLIIYRSETKPLQITRVLRAARDGHHTAESFTTEEKIPLDDLDCPARVRA